MLETAAERGYLACESCGAIVTLEGAELEAVRGSVRAASGFEPDLSHFPVVGRCARCADQPAGPKTSSTTRRSSSAIGPGARSANVAARAS